jgi:UDP-GlcNAc:undecaprenyl-phosphate/decaprenyl-phosphate GlcNAc-1-phosphate transferase
MPFLVALGTGLLAVPAAGWVGLRTGLVDRPGHPLRIHDRPVSLLGGLAVVAAALAGMAAAEPVLSPWVVGAAVLALLVGLADDARPLPAWLRLVGQAAVGGLLVAGGLRLEALGPLDAVAVVVLVLLLSNAVNFVDGQDGLAGGLALIAAAGLVGLAGWTDGQAAGALGLALMGGLVPFLAWNLPPARIFLGNGGAYAVGTILAVPAAELSRDWPGLAAATLCLGVFAFELVFTVVRRARARAPVTAGDRGHSYDAAAVALRDRTRSTVLFWLLGGAAAGLGLLVEALLEGGR